MEKDLMIILRANILGGMNTYVIENCSEDTQEYWGIYGVPDGANEDDLIEIAEDNELWVGCCKCFANCL
jgi:hypothetical protein